MTIPAAEPSKAPIGSVASAAEPAKSAVKGMGMDRSVIPMDTAEERQKQSKYDHCYEAIGTCCFGTCEFCCYFLCCQCLCDGDASGCCCCE